ncbi:unnamed protein product [Trichobilharzia szidati]|nr:unnamed protein product [Trichobilharzia szidati]
MAQKTEDVNHAVGDSSIVNRGLKILNGLKKISFASEHALTAAIFTGFRSIRLAAEWVASHARDPLLYTDFEVDFHVYMSIDKKFESDVQSFLSAARSYIGWSYVFDRPPHVPVLHLRVKPQDGLVLESIFAKTFSLFNANPPTDVKIALELLVDTEASVAFRFAEPKVYAVLQQLSEAFIENLSKVDLSFEVVSNSCKSNNLFTLVSSIKSCDEMNLILKQLKEAYLSNHYCINDGNRQIKFCLYSHDPRLRDSNLEVYEMLTNVESDILAYNDNYCTTKVDEDSVEQFYSGKIQNNTITKSNSSGLTYCDNSSNNISDNSTTNNSSQEYHHKHLSHYAGDYILLVDSVCLKERLGCPYGINLSTGESGLFNLSAGRRVPQSQTWTLHCSVPVKLSSPMESSVGRICTDENISEEFRKQTSQNSSLIAVNLNSSCRMPPPLLRQTLSSSSSSTSSSSSVSPSFPQSMLWKHSSRSSHSSSSESASDDRERNNNNNDNANNSTERTDTTTVTSHYSTTTTASTPATTPSQASVHFKCGGATTSCSEEFQLKLITSHNNNNYNENLNSANVDNGNKSGSGRHKITNSSTTAKRHNHAKRRQMYVMRHAERVDMSFGHAWVTQCFDHKGVYRRFNLNLPPWLPTRSDCLEYILDSPITQVGLFVSAETGRALADAGVQFTACYCSPAFRCVQTACELLRAMGRFDLPVRIEPHLFEWYGWYAGNRLPKMMTPHQLKQAGYNVDINYKPLSVCSDKDFNESIQGYCDRTALLIKRILNIHKSKDTCLLIVGHACSLDTCTRHLVNHGFRHHHHHISSDEFQHRTSIVPYCGLLLAEENRRWDLVEAPIPNACSYSRNCDYDWRELLGSTLCNFKIK